MRRIAFFLLASGLFWTGCIGNDSLGSSMSAQRNIDNLARISLGMTDHQVFQIMRQPYRSESFEIERERFEVWFYITRMLIMEQKEPTHVNMTPLVFRNGVLEGKGYNYYHKVLKQEEAVAEADSGQSPKEDYELEKALTPPPGSKPAQPTKLAPAPAQPATPPAKKKPPSKPAAKPKQPAPTNQPSQTNPSANQPVKQPFPLSSPGTQPAAPVQPGTQPANPAQPHPTQPAAPTQPGSSNKPASSSQSNVTMSKPSTPSEDAPKEEKKQKKPSKKEESQTNKKSKVPLTEEDEDVLQEERQENFDFW